MGAIYQPAFSVKPLNLRTSRARLRVVVSGKISKKATERNLIRRRVKDAWRLISSEEAVCIYVKKPALSMSFAQIKAELSQNLR
ncbi:ribonuclease P protein component [Patescibacteria group bacterium]|nr:ribonuclease P protein component [Patescibacteria group bacterium]